jgi:hypothetical protein
MSIENLIKDLKNTIQDREIDALDVCIEGVVRFKKSKGESDAFPIILLLTFLEMEADEILLNKGLDEFKEKVTALVLESKEPLFIMPVLAFIDTELEEIYDIYGTEGIIYKFIDMVNRYYVNNFDIIDGKIKN